MFGMPSKEFWEDDPQLYWAYRFSYEKEQEFSQNKDIEQLRFGCWLQGKTTEIAVAVALNNAFSKKRISYPTYNELFKDSLKNEESQIHKDLENLLAGVTDKEERASIEFNYWARL